MQDYRNRLFYIVILEIEWKLHILIDFIKIF